MNLPDVGHENCPVAAMRSAEGWPPPSGFAQLKGLTPWPASAWVRGTLSPLVWQPWESADGGRGQRLRHELIERGGAQVRGDRTKNRAIHRFEAMGFRVTVDNAS